MKLWMKEDDFNFFQWTLLNSLYNNDWTTIYAKNAHIRLENKYNFFYIIIIKNHIYFWMKNIGTSILAHYMNFNFLLMVILLVVLRQNGILSYNY